MNQFQELHGDTFTYKSLQQVDICSYSIFTLFGTAITWSNVDSSSVASAESTGQGIRFRLHFHSNFWSETQSPWRGYSVGIWGVFDEEEL
jgi:hypothetical protein